MNLVAWLALLAALLGVAWTSWSAAKRARVQASETVAALDEVREASSRIRALYAEDQAMVDDVMSRASARLGAASDTPAGPPQLQPWVEDPLNKLARVSSRDVLLKKHLVSYSEFSNSLVAEALKIYANREDFEPVDHRAWRTAVEHELVGRGDVVIAMYVDLVFEDVPTWDLLLKGSALRKPTTGQNRRPWLMPDHIQTLLKTSIGGAEGSTVGGPGAAVAY